MSRLALVVAFAIAFVLALESNSKARGDDTIPPVPPPSNTAPNGGAGDSRVSVDVDSRGGVTVCSNGQCSTQVRRVERHHVRVRVRHRRR